MGVAGHIDTAQDNGCQNRQRQNTAHHAQFLTNGGENEVRMAVGQTGAVLALGLDTIEQAHTRQLAAAQRHQTAGLVPAYVQGLIAVVKNHDEAVFHIRLDHILLPEDIKRKHCGNTAADEPPGRHTRHKTHADENEHEHQSAAHIGGYGIVQAKDHHQVRAQKQHIRDLLQRAVLL